MSKTAILAIARAPVSALAIRSSHLAYTHQQHSLSLIVSFSLTSYIRKRSKVVLDRKLSRDAPADKRAAIL